MASFSGTQSKCKSCQKTAYPMEQIVVEGVILHKGCFRCSHCKNTLKLDNFVSLEGVFYCKTHFAQLFQTTGSIFKSFDEAVKTEKENPPPPESITGEHAAGRYTNEKKEPSPIANKFGGTQDKCLACGQIVYPLEKISVESNAYHTGCFKCVHGGCTLTSASFKSFSGKLYCKHHHNQLFLIKGRFSTLEDEAVDSATKKAETATKKAVEEVVPAAPVQETKTEIKEVSKEMKTPPPPSKGKDEEEEAAAEEEEEEDDDDDDDDEDDD